MECLRDRTGLRPPARAVGTDAHVDAALRAAVEHHHVAATVARQLSALPRLSEPTRDALATARRAQAVKSLRTSVDLGVVGAALGGQGIPWVVVKGPAVATLYPDPLMRQYVDLDVLVSRFDMRRALDALTTAGATLVDRNWPLVARKVAGEISLALPHGTGLDLHWALVNDRVQRQQLRLPPDELLARRRTVDNGRVAFPALDAGDQLVHLAVHAFVSGGRRLSWLKDLQLGVDVVDDWDRVTDDLERWGLAAAVGALLQRADQVLGLALPHGVLARLQSPWRHALSIADRLVPPALDHAGPRRLSGTEVLWASRPTMAASAKALVTAAARRAAGDDVADGAEELHRDVPDAAAAERWLTTLEGDSVP